MRTTLNRVIGALLLTTLFDRARLDGLCSAIAVLNKALIRVTRTLLNSAFEYIPMLDILHLFIATAGHARVLGLVLAADGCAHVANVTILVILVAFLLL